MPLQQCSFHQPGKKKKEEEEEEEEEEEDVWTSRLGTARSPPLVAGRGDQESAGAFIPLLIAIIYLHRIFASGKPAEVVRGWLKCLVAAAFLTGLGILLTTANTQYFDVPMCAMVCIILAEVLGRAAEFPHESAEVGGR